MVGWNLKHLKPIMNASPKAQKDNMGCLIMGTNKLSSTHINRAGCVALEGMG